MNFNVRHAVEAPPFLFSSLIKFRFYSFTVVSLLIFGIEWIFKIKNKFRMISFYMTCKVRIVNLRQNFQITKQKFAI